MVARRARRWWAPAPYDWNLDPRFRTVPLACAGIYFHLFLHAHQRGVATIPYTNHHDA